MKRVRMKSVFDSGGMIQIQIPEPPPPGTEAEVIVLFESPGQDAPKVRSFSELRGAAKGLYPTPEDADRFISEERDAWEERLSQL